MERILMVSNRLPVSVQRKDRNIVFVQSKGGLATGLASFHQRHDSLWLGWPGIASDRLSEEEKASVAEALAGWKCRPVHLTQREVEGYYHGFSNRTVWPLFHYFIQHTYQDPGYWHAYVRVNEVFRDAVCDLARPGDLIWVHDYHLMLLPKMIRERLPDANVGFFLHIPFPSSEVFRLLPWREEILEGLLGADLVGFHTYDYALHFLSSVRRLLGHDNVLGRISAGDRVVSAEAFPMGIDYERFATESAGPEVLREIEGIRQRTGGRRVVLSIDRLDYTKGIPQRLRAFDRFLQRYPSYRERVTLILIASPSRTGVSEYRELKREVERLVGETNGRHGTLGWVPVWYIFQSVPFTRLLALYRVADVGLITPMRDGMNLIAKEFVAAKRSDQGGVLILSELAGASKELCGALVVNPNDIDRMVDALRAALEMKPEEQAERLFRMQAHLSRYTVTDWANEFVMKLYQTKREQMDLRTQELTGGTRDRLVGAYASSSARLLFLDYDGTLQPFAPVPEAARPDPEVLDILGALASDTGTEVVLISGRDRGTVEAWFGRLDIGLVAEHGLWVRERGGTWRAVEKPDTVWKPSIRPIMESFEVRLPGSFVEEKTCSLAYHYRNADPVLATVRVNELKETLRMLTANRAVDVLEGHKVLEVRYHAVNKGRGARSWLDRGEWDFVLAIGDDWTDEDLFAALPEGAYSVKVGFGASRATYRLEGVSKVRRLLMDLAASRSRPRREGSA